jgi:hypothetical protein
MFGFGRRRGDAAFVVVRGEIVGVSFGRSTGGEGNQTTRYAVRVMVRPDGGAEFEVLINVKLRGTAGPMIGEETWVRYLPSAPRRAEFDRERIKDRCYDRVRDNPGLRVVVDTLYRHGDLPVSVFATAR